MIKVQIPGYGDLEIENLVLDYNGTLAEDGRLLEGVKEMLVKLSDQLNCFVITADTFGSVSEELRDCPVEIYKLSSADEATEKEAFVMIKGPEKTVAIGNGRNDGKMLQKAAVGICVIGSEGAAVEAMTKANVMVKDIRDGLNLLISSNRLKATLRA